MGSQRFDIFIEKHIGFGIRWDRWHYECEVSIAVMCVTITIGFGKKL